MIFIVCSHYDHKVAARVHSVNLMNVEQSQAATDPQTKLPDLGCESVCRLLCRQTYFLFYTLLSKSFLNTLFRINNNTTTTDV